MKRSSISRCLIGLMLVGAVVGAIAAHADSGGTAPGPGQARLVPPPVAVWGVTRCRPSKPSGAPAAAPSQALLNAFATLRRERRPEDALPAAALAALERAGVAPVAAESARLLRTGFGGGRAWVVPVPDVTRALGLPCVRVLKEQRSGKPSVPAAPQPRPREGLAVVALGDAAPGGGGALDDLVRGRAPVHVDPCAGEDHDMLSVSGIVPDGVAAVFLTAPDGTAVKADVEDNGFELLIPARARLSSATSCGREGMGHPTCSRRWPSARRAARHARPSASARRSPKSRRTASSSPHARSPARSRSRHHRSRSAIAPAVSDSPSPRPAAHPGAQPHSSHRSPRYHCPPRRPRCRRASTGELRRTPAHAASAQAHPLAAPNARRAGSLARMAAPRPLVVLALLAVTAAAVSISILAWTAIATRNDLDRVVDKADQVANDASRSVRRLDRTNRDLDAAIRSLRRSADALRQGGGTAP